ncbi:MAG: hypothetical protein COU40_00020 [Candidatus Moranbacteria bacterium CG10_big_fil_rev_8_21_14_0_10_35_21]|nr:MAG: hypothetical protein COU40_00020 [Candidatus Moranbacteria bacterium CG10_big_fil_rev_8_21_14_0_10_35_21]PJA88444.1 MAG: hypothetical protein CO139_02985 [Candidatus Moranbacteria bacterium CG_4_9_14_3_um_filter_36_9]
MQYELFYLIGSSQEANFDKIKSEVEAITTSEGGAFEEKEVIEKRRLAYPINHEVFGAYVARRFQLEDASKLQSITKKLNLMNNLLRFLISRTEELPELKSREERKNDEKAKAKIQPKETPKEKKEVKKSPEEISKPKEQSSSEDIDKKLEEILNI